MGDTYKTISWDDIEKEDEIQPVQQEPKQARPKATPKIKPKTIITPKTREEIKQAEIQSDMDAAYDTFF